jgi:hypothetical protein
MEKVGIKCAFPQASAIRVKFSNRVQSWSMNEPLIVTANGTRGSAHSVRATEPRMEEAIN